MNGYAKYKTVEKLTVSFDLEGAVMPIGNLAWSAKDRRAYFEFDRSFIDRNLPISPFKLPLKSGLVEAPPTPFGGLHGLFNDSLPDGWGRWLLDRQLRKHNYNKDELTPVDRLTYVGARGMGALHYQPENLFRDPETGDEINLDWLAIQAERFQDEFDEADIDVLYDMQGASGGARPKIMIGFKPSNGRMVADVGKPLPQDFEHWIIKFRSKTNDPAEIGAEEYAYSLMAKAAGVYMPETKLLMTPKGKYFAVRRFDRTSKGNLHIQTASGLLEADHNVPQIDYDTLLKMTRVLTRDDEGVRQVFRRMTFNVLARNRDDHSKNHAFEMPADGIWKPTPAYDLTLSAGPGGQHSLAIAGEGKNPQHSHILKEAAEASVSKGDADAMYEQVLQAVNKWPDHAERATLSDRRMAEIDYLLNHRGQPPKGGVKLATHA
ncbi:MAG: type II toxin-antitoxin system HipA family toxin [Pseudolabrys sp.]